MARSLRTAAVLSFCAILVPAGCDSPISPPEIEPSAAVTPDGTVITTVKDQVPFDGWLVAGECLNDGLEPFATNGALTVTHRLTATPASGGKTYLVKLSTIALPKGVSLVGLQSATELVAIGADEVEVRDEVALPYALETVLFLPSRPNEPTTSHQDVLSPGEEGPILGTVLELRIAEDFGVTRTLDEVEIICPPPPVVDG